MADDAQHPMTDDLSRPAVDDAHPSAGVTRSVDVDAGVDEVWDAVSDPDERALWLDDPDALARRVRIDECRPGERLVWTWWHPGDEGDASTVSVDLQPATGGGTHVVVTEVVPAIPPTIVASAPAAGRRPPAWSRCATDRWDARLLGLELLFVNASVRVG